MEKDRFTNSCDLDKAEILNKYFTSVFTQDPGSAPPNLGPSLYPKLPSFEGSISEVNTLLNEVDPFKATSPDGIPPRLLKELASKLFPSLTLLFNISLNQGFFASQSEDSISYFLFKKGDHDNPTNYRPISLTSVCSKLMERIMAHLNKYNILTKCQFGFCAKHSTKLAT